MKHRFKTTLIGRENEINQIIEILLRKIKQIPF